MSKRRTKIFKRQASREARAKLGSEMELLKDIFKGKPRWTWPVLWLKFLGLFIVAIFFPTKAWEWGLSIYIRKGDFDFKPWESVKPSKAPRDL